MINSKFVMPVIEDGIPFPGKPNHSKKKVKKREYKSKWRSLFSKMKVGQSFLVPVEYKHSSIAQLIWNNTRHYRTKKFSAIQIMTKDGVRYRCWRIQ